MSAPALAVIAKAPLAGHSKTRLCPPCRPEQAAALAGAALRDTLAAVAAAPAARRVLVLEGEPGDWVPPGFELIAQSGGGLEARLAAAFDAIGEPTLLVGMDTPQLDASLLARAADQLAHADAVLGAAPDGGYWAIGLRRPDARAFEGIPMSSPRTSTAQLERLAELELRCERLPELRDVDTIADARAVARAAPLTRFASTLRSLQLDRDGEAGARETVS